MFSVCAPHHAFEQVRSEPACQLIDVREYPEFAAVHATRARLMPVGRIGDRAGELDPSRPVLLLCKSGQRAARAETLCAAGFKSVTVVEGGTDAWVAAGLPTEKKSGAWSIERQVRLIAGTLVLIGLFIPPWPWLSLLVGSGLVFAGLSNTCAMGMLLAKMPWNRAPAAKPACCAEAVQS